MHYVKMAEGEEDKIVRKEMLDILENPQHHNKKLLKAVLRVFRYYTTVAEQGFFDKSTTGQTLREYL